MSAPAIIWICLASFGIVLNSILSVSYRITGEVGTYKVSFLSGIISFFLTHGLYYWGGIYTFPLSVPAILLLGLGAIGLLAQAINDGKEKQHTRFPLVRSIITTGIATTLLYYAGFFS